MYICMYEFECIHECSVVGSILVIGGLYSVLLGKKMEAGSISVDAAATKPAGEGNGVLTQAV